MVEGCLWWIAGLPSVQRLVSPVTTGLNRIYSIPELCLLTTPTSQKQEPNSPSKTSESSTVFLSDLKRDIDKDAVWLQHENLLQRDTISIAVLVSVWSLTNKSCTKITAEKTWETMLHSQALVNEHGMQPQSYQRLTVRWKARQSFVQSGCLLLAMEPTYQYIISIPVPSEWANSAYLSLGVWRTFRQVAKCHHYHFGGKFLSQQIRGLSINCCVE